jgi:tRNA pseudouridine55 synthase
MSAAQAANSRQVTAGKKRMPNGELCGIVNINKPIGLTSHDVVNRVRRMTGQRKVGHAGTLDPAATGVLLLCLGRATRVVEHLTASDKTYRARIRLGISTDTYDVEGEITSQSATHGVTRPQVERELGSWVGSLEQIPPMYSAVKHNGTPLYRLARRGQTVARRARKVQIWAAKLLEWAPPELEVEVRCSKGTYIRSLAHDLGQHLGCGAHLVGLTRMASGDFRVEQAVSLEELEQACAENNVARLLQPLDSALQAFPAITVDQPTARKITLGQRVQLSAAPGARMCRAYAGDGRLLALLRYDDDRQWRPDKVFVQPTNDENHP